MQTDMTPVLGIFCAVPTVLFLVGFFVGRWSARVRIVRVDQAGAAVNDARMTRAAANAPAPVRRIVTGNPAGEREN